MAKNSRSKQDLEQLAATWKKRFSVAEGNQESLFKKFAQWYDAFNARVSNVGSPWRSKPYLPIIAQQVWALVAKFASLRPGFEVKLRDDEANDDAELEERANSAQKKLEYDYDCPYMSEPMRDKIASCMIDASVTGTGLAEVTWRTFKKIRRERIVDEEGNADLTQEKVIETVVGYNEFTPVNIFNVFVAPGSEDLYSAPWIIIRSFTPISDLKKHNDAKGGKFYANLEKLSGDPVYGNFQTYNNARNRMTQDGDTKDSTVDTATIYKCYEGDDLYIFGEDKTAAGQGGWVLLRHTKNYYWHGKYPLVKFHVKKRPYSFWGQGLAELAYRLQVIYNDVFAHYLDAWNLTNNPSFWASESSDVDDYVIEPGSINTYKGDKPPTAIDMKDPDPNALQALIGMLQQSIEGVTASQYATGMATSASDQTKGTATGIVKLQDAAGDIVGYFRENLTTSLVQVGKMWFSNNQQFLDRPVPITVNNKGKRESMTVGPADIKGEAEIYVDSASMLPKSDEDKRNDSEALIQGLLKLQEASIGQAQMTGTDPLYIDFNDAADKLGEGFDNMHMESLLLSPEDVMELAQEKQDQLEQMQGNIDMGYHPNPNMAAQQMAQELIDDGELDPNELEQAALEEEALNG